MKYSAQIRLRNNGYSTVTVDARDSGQAKALISQQYGVREQDIVNFYERQDLYFNEQNSGRAARQEASRIAEQERRDHDRRERQERLDREVAERRHRELIAAQQSKHNDNSLLTGLAAAAAGYAFGRATAPEPTVVIVEPKRDWDDFSDIYERRERERRQAEQEEAYAREQEERDQEAYEAERARSRAEFEAECEAKNAASRKYTQYFDWIIPLFNTLTLAEKAYATAYLFSLGQVFNLFPEDILAGLEGISNPDAVGTLVEKVEEGPFAYFRFIDNEGGFGYCVNDNSAIRKEILAYGFDLETFRLSQNKKRLKTQANRNDQVLNRAYKVIRETLDKLWEPVKADELSYGVFVGQPGHNPVEDASALSAQIEAYETLLTKLAEATIDVDAIFPWSTFGKVRFAFICAEDETVERGAVMRCLTERINQLFQRERQAWIEDATRKLDLLEAEHTSKPKSIWERLFNW